MRTVRLALGFFSDASSPGFQQFSAVGRSLSTNANSAGRGMGDIEGRDYTFRPDVTFRSGMTYDVKDLDVTKPGVRRPPQRAEFKVTTEEVLRKADFRNVRFLANFLTEAGIIIKRSQTGISAKAQRKVAREIKTARAFGLMPFTTMGTKPFVCGKTMEDLDEDYEYESFGGDVVADPE
ncbi:Ribosomal protein [Trema orientale]|uniref:Small ribosomal subunit protein bS18c n=1 Tax=Trema orientale TaxID=63057 RepID=A0A2P5E5X9_TREOI|nr:Ribosomal protein [Trema orientale]